MCIRDRLAAAALLCHPGMHTAGSHKTRATLDGLAIGTAVLLLSWTFVLGSLWRHTDLTTAGGIVALAYPFGDIVIIFLIVLSVRSMTVTGRRPLLWVLVGLFAMAVSDSIYAYLVEAGRYSTGNLVDIGWVVGYLAIAVGASGDASQTCLLYTSSLHQGDCPALTSVRDRLGAYLARRTHVEVVLEELAAELPPGEFETALEVLVGCLLYTSRCV